MKRLAVVLAVVAVVAACGSDGDSEDDQSSGDNQTTAMPTEIVATSGDRVVVLSSKSGKVVRTLVEGPDAAGASSVAVSGDGELVYFTRADPDALCGEVPARQIATVPIDGGEVLVYASGQDPVVSPDGSRLAYATGGPNQCGPPTLIAVEELGADTFSQQLIDEGGSALRPLAWAQDGQRILFEAASSPDSAPELRISDDPPPSSVYGLSGTAATFRGNRVAVALPAGDGFRVVVDKTPPESGVRRLLRADGSSPTALAFDKSGDSLAHVSGGSLFRWSEGDDKPQKLADNVIVGAWVPLANAS